VTQGSLKTLEKTSFSASQFEALRRLSGRAFNHAWQLGDALAEMNKEWQLRGGGLKNKLHDRKIKQKLSYLNRTFHWRTP
jgi:hypothetical protein